jgi:parvulin-like peptidyl-prolyl isomerase
MKVSFFLLILVVLFACEKQEQDIVASVNDKTLTLEKFRANFSQEEWRQMSKQKKESYLQEWIHLALLSQEADNLGITTTPQLQARLENSVNKIKANALIANRLATLTATEEELFDYYKINQNRFQEEEKQYFMHRILCKEASKLDFIRQEIADKSFSNAAKTHSEENLGKNGGVVGWVSQNDIESIFWNAMEELEPKYYRTIHTTNGYYIVRYTESRKIKKPKNFLDVKEEVRELLLDSKRSELYEKLIHELQSKADIVISM